MVCPKKKRTRAEEDRWKMRPCTIKAIDFFCGAGGLTRGMLDAGIEVLAGIDNDPTLRETYAKNNAPSIFLCEDIRRVNIHELRNELGITPEDSVLYAACTPCQPFSTLTRKKGGDDRKNLLLAFAELVRECPPDFILVENVPGLKTAYGKEVYTRFIGVLHRCQFRDVYGRMIDAQDFGVPQVRKRFILLASRHGPIRPPRRARKKRTVRDALKQYPPIRDGESSAQFDNHQARPLKPHLRRIVEAVPRDGGSRSDVKDKSILLKCHRENPGAHKDVFGRMAWDKAAPTLTCRCTDVYCGRFVHPEQDRGISLREAAALQTFPDSYEFHGGSILHVARQIGNAVPVKLAERLGRAIISSSKRIQEGRRG